MAKSGLADRLYRGEANLDIIGRRNRWFAIAAILLLLALRSFIIRGFHLGIEFSGGTQFIMPARVGTQADAQSAVSRAIAAADVPADTQVSIAQKVGNGADATYTVRTSSLTQEEATAVKAALVTDTGVADEDISDNRVSAAWGEQVTRQALIGFEVTPSTVIGFLTILGFALYDVVVVFDKVQENTRGITANSNQTYAEDANLAVNQTLMRSINTGLVALLPVGGLLFIGAILLKAGTLKDLSLVLFVGMGIAVYSSIFFATPVLVTLKQTEPRIKAHTQRVLARRAAIASGR